MPLKRHLKKKVTIALGNSVYNNKVRSKTVSIRTLFHNLAKPIVTKKKDNKYFVFASFTGNVRNASAVKEYYGATIDLDDTKLTPEAIKDKFGKYAYFIYTTHSHKAPGKGDRYRLVIPFTQPVNPNVYIETTLYIISELGGETNVDLSTKALSRPMYLPATHPKRKDTFEHISNPGKRLFNPHASSVRDKVAALAFEYAELTASAEINPVDLKEEIGEGDRNNTLARAVGKFISTGVAVKDLYPMAESWNQLKLTPPLSSKEVKTIVDSIVKAHKRNNDDMGWGYDEILDRIKKNNNIEQDLDHLIQMIVFAKSKRKIKPAQQELLINQLQRKAKITKKLITDEMKTKELELAGKAEESEEEGLVTSTSALKKDFQDWVYIATDDRMYNVKTAEYFRKEAFSAMYASPSVEGSLFSTLMKYSLVKKASKLEFDPAQPELYIRDKITYANTYISPDIFPLPGDVNRILKHFKFLIPDDRERNIVLDFIAHLVQKPGVKIRWMPVIKGGKGIGKTFIGEKIIMPMIGFGNFGKVSNELIKSDFNAWQLDKQLVVFEELDIGANRREKEQLTDRLKSFITDNILTAHRKGLDPYDTLNKANSIGFTNKEDAIIITADERRFCMIRTDAKPRRDSYYMKLAKFADTHLEEMYYYFMNRDLTGFSPLRAPTTDYTEEVKRQSQSWPGIIIRDMMEDDDLPISQVGVFTHRQLVDHIRANSNGKYRSLSDDLLSAGSAVSKNLYNILRDQGFQKYQPKNKKTDRIRFEGKLTSVWMMPDRIDEFYKETEKNIIKLVSKIKVKDEDWDE